MHEKTVGEHDQSEMPMQAVSTVSLEVIESAILLGIFVKLFDDPASVGPQVQSFQGCIGNSRARVIFIKWNRYWKMP